MFTELSCWCDFPHCKLQSSAAVQITPRLQVALLVVPESLFMDTQRFNRTFHRPYKRHGCLNRITLNTLLMTFGFVTQAFLWINILYNKVPAMKDMSCISLFCKLASQSYVLFEFLQRNGFHTEMRC